jgi:N-acetylmuramoyl-L-alanine amidase
MLTRKYNPKISYISRLLALPLAVFIVLAFTVKTKNTGTIIFLEKEITVVIDAGHGGGNGAKAEGYTEDDLVLQLAKTIKANNRNDKLNIILTREADHNVEIKDRVKFAEVNNADLFISLHMNAAPIGFSNSVSSSSKQRTKGFEILVSNKNTVYQKQSELLGSALIDQISKSNNTFKNLIKRQTGIWILDQNVCPSVGIECGYITDKGDRDFIIKKENQELIAQKILSAIELYAANNTTLANPIKPNLIDTTPKKASGMFFDTKNKIAIEFQEMIEAANPVLLTEALLIVNGERVPNDIFKTKTIVTNKLKFIEGKDAVRTYGLAASTGAVVFEGARYIDVPVTEYYKDIFYPKTPVKSDPDNIIFEKAQVEAEFPGGLQAWSRFVEKNLNAQGPTTNKAPQGNYTVITKFIVKRDGTISDVKALTKHGYGMEEEAIRLIRRGPKWTPAIQNGKPVNAYRQQPVTFYVANK